MWVYDRVAWQSGYMKSRQDLLSSIQDAANDADAAATLVWQVYAWPIESHDTYNFDWSQPGNEALRTQIELMKEKVTRYDCEDKVPGVTEGVSLTLLFPPGGGDAVANLQNAWTIPLCLKLC